MTLIVVGCGKRKLEVAARACDLYTGSLFVAAKRYAEAKEGLRWVVLSAAHGVVGARTWLRPYDQVLDFKGEALVRWARLAAMTIAERRIVVEEPIEILAGAGYAEPLARELRELGVEPVSMPLSGLGVGKRLNKLKTMAEDLQRGRASSVLEKGKRENGGCRDDSIHSVGGAR